MLPRLVFTRDQVLTELTKWRTRLDEVRAQVAPHATTPETLHYLRVLTDRLADLDLVRERLAPQPTFELTYGQLARWRAQLIGPVESFVGVIHETSETSVAPAN